jgi:hypothetical protein
VLSTPHRQPGELRPTKFNDARLLSVWNSPGPASMADLFEIAGDGTRPDPFWLAGLLRVTPNVATEPRNTYQTICWRAPAADNTTKLLVLQSIHQSYNGRCTGRWARLKTRSMISLPANERSHAKTARDKAFRWELLSERLFLLESRWLSLLDIKKMPQNCWRAWPQPYVVRNKYAEH